MVERKFSGKRHLTAAILAIFIFLIGLSFGMSFNQLRASFLEQKIEVEKQDLESLQVQYLFLTSVLENDKNCIVARKTLDHGIYELSVLSGKLDTYLDDQPVSDEESFKALKREYTLAQFRYWLLAEEIKKLCGNGVVTVLYFYSSDDCEDCRTQGVILTYLKSVYKDKLLNFVFDAGFSDEPMIDIIKESYNIKETPALIINGKVYNGLITEEELTKVICGSLKEEDICKNS